MRFHPSKLLFSKVTHASLASAVRQGTRRGSYMRLWLTKPWSLHSSIATLLFILFFISTSSAGQNPEPHIQNIIHEISSASYRVHFDSINCYKGCYRKVIKSEIQHKHHDQCRDYIYRCFCKWLGNQNTYIHNFEIDDYKGLANVIGFKKGLKPWKGTWIISAHYDSNNNLQPDNPNMESPGANDNGTGIAAILEIARVLSNIDTDESILFAAWDMEEIYTNGMPSGSNKWYEEHVRNRRLVNWNEVGEGGIIGKRDIRANINFDMIGNPQHLKDGLPVLSVYHANNFHEIFAKAYCNTVNRYTDSLVAEYKGRLILSDHYTFGIRRILAVVNLESGFRNDSFYHTYDDNLENPDNIDFDFASKVTRGGLAFMLEQILPLKLKKQVASSIQISESPFAYFFSTPNHENLKVYDSRGKEVKIKLQDGFYTFSPTESGVYNLVLTGGKSGCTYKLKLQKKENAEAPSFTILN